jgi:hypothetical protein
MESNISKIIYNKIKEVKWKYQGKLKCLGNQKM